MGLDETKEKYSTPIDRLLGLDKKIGKKNILELDFQTY